MTFHLSEDGHHGVRNFLQERGSTVVARRGAVVDSLAHPRVVVEQDGNVVGVLTYIVDSAKCEILTLHVARKRLGVGTTLVMEAAQRGTVAGCTRYEVTTTNDNIDALRFYQRRGFRLVETRCGAVDLARRTLKPDIPLVGDYGIPLRDEIELAQELPLRPPRQ